MKTPFWVRWLLFGISACIVALGQPDLSLILSLVTAACGYTLAWIAILPEKRRFLWGTLWFFLVSLGHLSWIASPLYQGVYIIAVYLLLAAWLAIQFGFLCHLAHPDKIRTRFFWLIALWVGIEWLRIFVFCGYVWHPIGLALSAHLTAAQLAIFGGPLFLSFWVLLTNFTGWVAWKQRGVWLYTWAALALFPYAFGALRLTHSPSMGMISAYIVQPMWLPDDKPERTRPHVEWLRWLKNIEALSSKPDYIILPEVVLPYHFTEGQIPYAHAKEMVKEWPESALPPPVFPYVLGYRVTHAFWSALLANVTGAELIAGFEAVEQGAHFNAAFHTIPYGLVEHYNKRALLPIAEVLPFSFLRSLAARYGVTAFFTPGEEATITGQKKKVTLSVCYDDCFPNLIREGAVKGADLLVNVTNDGWYAFSRLPAVHYYHARLRAIELGLPFFRASNTGYSAAIDSYGREWGHFQTPYCAREEQVFLPSHTHPTPFARFGYVPLFFLCVVTSAFSFMRTRMQAAG